MLRRYSNNVWMLPLNKKEESEPNPENSGKVPRLSHRSGSWKSYQWIHTRPAITDDEVINEGGDSGDTSELLRQLISKGRTGSIA